MTNEPRTDGAVFADRTRTIVITVSVISLVATVIALVYGRQLAPPPAQPRDSYGHGPLGHRAFFETMDELGFHADRWTTPHWDPVSAPLFFIEPNAPVIEHDGAQYSLGEIIRARMTANRVTVLVLPKWQPTMFGMVEPTRRREIDELLAQLTFEVTLASDSDLKEEYVTVHARQSDGTERTLEVVWPQRIHGGIALLADDEGSFVVHDDKHLVYVVSDPDLVHSFNVQRADHAAFWSAFVRGTLGSDSLVIDEVFHGSIEHRSLAELFAGWPGSLSLVHAAAIVLVLLLMARKRFGPPLRIEEALGRGPREVIEVAASVLSNGSKLSTLVLRYVEQSIGDLHRRLGLADGKTIEGRAEMIDQAAERRRIEPRSIELLTKARALGPRARLDVAMAIAREASAFRARMLGAKRPTDIDKNKEMR